MKISESQIFERTIKLAESEGWSNLTVRSIAKRIGYSTIKIYSDYGSKEGLLAHLRKEGFGQIEKDYDKAADTADGTIQKLIAVSGAHVLFAIENGALYDLMFSLNGASCDDGALGNKRKVAQGLQRLVDPLHDKDSNQVFLQYYALITGLAIITREMKGMSKEDVVRFVGVSIENFVKGIS